MKDESKETRIATTRPAWASGLTFFDDDAYTGLDLQSLEGRKMFVHAQQSDPIPTESVINTTLEIVNFLVHPAESTDPVTGSTDRWTRTVLFLKNTKMVAFGSQGILKSIRAGLMMFGPPPWPGLRAKLIQQQLDSQRRWYVLQWDLEQGIPCQNDQQPSEQAQATNSMASKSRSR